MNTQEKLNELLKGVTKKAPQDDEEWANMVSTATKKYTSHGKINDEEIEQLYMLQKVINRILSLDDIHGY